MASAVVETTVDELRREIDELHRQQREITERLRDPRGLRKGALAGGPRNAGAGPLRPAGRGGPLRGLRRGPLGDSEGQPPPKKRLLSAVVKVDEVEEPATADDAQNGDAKERDAEADEEGGDQKPNSAAGPQPGRRDSRRGDRGYKEPEDHIVEPQPRVLPKVDDPNVTKRNRRMFGALLGTLEKFRQEDQKLSGSDAFMRRSDSLKRAEQKAQEESERLRQQEREQLAEKRRKDLMLRGRIAAKAEEKQLELLFIHWTEHQTKLATFLRTKAEPAIFWMPAKPSEETDKLLEERQKELSQWKDSRREELSAYQAEISTAHIAHVEAEIERWQSRAQGRNNAASDDAEMEIGMEIANGPKKFGIRISKTVEEDDQDKVDDDGEDDLEVPEEEDDVDKKNGTEDGGVLTSVLGYGSGEDVAKER